MEEQNLSALEVDDTINWDGYQDEVSDCLHGDDALTEPEEDEADQDPVPARRIRLYRQQYEPVRVRYVPKTVRLPVLIDGKITNTYLSAEITEFVDVQTGEILPATKRGPLSSERPINHGEMLMQRQGVLAQLRPEVRHFASFVLEFRDHRRGLTPGMDTLVKWYAELHDRRASDVRRLVPSLEAAGLCIGDCMCPLFQWAETRWQRSNFLGELELANYKFAKLLREKERGELVKSMTASEHAAMPSGQLAVLLMTVEEARQYKLAQQEATAPTSPKLSGKRLRSRVVVPLQHLQRSVPSDGSQLDDVREAIGEPRGSGVPKVMEAQVLQFSTSAESSEHLVQCSNTDWKDGLAA